MSLSKAYYCRESGVRNLKKYIEKAYRKVAYKIVSNKEEKMINIDANVLKEFVGQPLFDSDRLYHDYSPPGVVMGLAWSSMGIFSLII